MSTFAVAYDISIDSAAAQLTEKEHALAKRARALVKQVQARADVGAIFAGIDTARKSALAARQDALLRSEMALEATECRLKEIEREHKQAVALVRARAPSIAVEAELDRDQDVELFTGFSRDLAQGGVFVPTVASLELGTQVDLELRLPERTVRVRGEVRWIREGDGLQAGLGIGFVAVEANTLAFFSALETEPMFYPD